MKYLGFPVPVILLALLSSCSTLPLFKDTTKQKPPSYLPIAHTSTATTDIVGTQTIEQFIRQRFGVFLSVAALLWMWLFYRLQYTALKRKERLKLNDEDLALLGLASDTLDDLWHRLQAKSKPKIIPFPQGNLIYQSGNFSVL